MAQLAKIVAAVIGSVVLLFVVAAVALTIAWGWGYVDEEWPYGETRRIRSQAETIFPPPSGVGFANVRRYGGGGDTSYRECIYYSTDARAADLEAHYRAIAEGLGWEVRITATQFYTNDRTGRASEIVSTRETAPGQYVIKSSRMVNPLGAMWLWFDSGKGYRYSMCSQSWDGVVESVSTRR